MAVYLIHFERPIGNLSKSRAKAQHYLGWAQEGLDRRLAQHATGRGSKITKFLHQHGIGFALARVWQDGGYHLEKALKERKNAPRLCPICQGLKAYEPYTPMQAQVNRLDLEDQTELALMEGY